MGKVGKADFAVLVDMIANRRIIAIIETKGAADRITCDDEIRKLSRPGMLRTDTVKKAISNAYQVSRAFPESLFFIVTSHVPDRVEKYIKDFAVRTGRNISDIREILLVLSLITPLHEEKDIAHLETVLFDPENAALQDVLRIAYSGNSDLLFLSGKKYVFKYDLMANYLGQQFVKKEKEIHKWMQRLLPYMPLRISINLFQTLEYDRQLMHGIFNLFSITWSHLNTTGGKTPEYFGAIQFFTGNLNDYPFFRIENVNIKRWMECYKELSKDYSDKEVREELAMGLYNAAKYYGKAGQFSKMEECLDELRTLHREYPEKEVREELAMGLVNATRYYAEATEFSKMEECLDELRTLHREHPEKEVREKLAMGLVNATGDYGKAGQFSKIEECLDKLRTLHREHPEKEVREELAKGLFNAMVLRPEIENHYTDLLLLYKLKSYLPETPDKEMRIESIKELLLTTTVEKLKKSKESAIKETLHTIKSELSDVEFVLLMNEISDRLPWEVQKNLWKIIDSEQF
ncbi:MAG: hypothetical protein HXS48_08785 [Theionarchaea archaeon]|nr:hypothetical protein [Theionarchaea archaeon]